MDISELIGQISIGNVPITIYKNKVYNGIYCFVRITKNNKVFLDYDTESDANSAEGGFRATFMYENFEKMICSIERYTKLKVNDLLPVYIGDENIKCNGDKCNDDWISFKNDLYYHKVPLLTGYTKMVIGDIYWEGLYNQEISPKATAIEIVKWFEERI